MWGNNQYYSGAMIPGASQGPVTQPAFVSIPSQTILSVSVGSAVCVACTLSGNAYAWGAGIAGFANVSLPSLDICSKVRADATSVYVQTIKGSLISWAATSGTSVDISSGLGSGERVQHFTVIQGAGMLFASSYTGLKVYSFGLNFDGVLMLDASSDPGLPRPAALLTTWVSSLPSSVTLFRANMGVFYVLLANGELHAWGQRSKTNLLCLSSISLEIFDTQRAASSTTRYNEAVKYAPGSGYATDASHAALMEDGSILVWSYFTDKGYIPTHLSAPTTFSDIRVGNRFVMLLSTSGEIYTFGANEYVFYRFVHLFSALSTDAVFGLPFRAGQLGRNTGGIYSTIPQIVAGVSGIVSISAGARHPLAISASGRAVAWGGSFGFDGLTPALPYSPTSSIGVGITPQSLDYSRLLSGSTQVAQIEWRHNSAYLRLTDGTLYAWGANNERQLCLGASATDAFYGSPQSVPLSGGIAVANVQSGLGWVSFMTTTGSIYGCGNNAYGSLGNGQRNQAGVHTPAAADLSAISAPIASHAVGLYHTIILTTTNELWTFGGASGNGLGLQSYSGAFVNGSYYIVPNATKVDQSGVLKDRRIVSIHAGDATHITAVPFLPDSSRAVATTSPRITMTGAALYENTALSTIPPVDSTSGSLSITSAAVDSFVMNNNGNLTAGTALYGDVKFPATLEIIRGVRLGLVVNRTPLYYILPINTLWCLLLSRCSSHFDRHVFSTRLGGKSDLDH